MKRSRVQAAFAKAISASKENDDWGRAIVRSALVFMGLPCETILMLDVIVLDVGGRGQVKGSCSLGVYNCGGELGIGARGSIQFVVSESAVGDGMHYFEIALADAKTKLAASAEFIARAERAQLEAAHTTPYASRARRQGRL